jgi:hypothetical protein
MISAVSRPGVLAGDQHVGADFTADRPSISEAFCLLTTQIGKACTCPRTSDDPGHRGLRFSMADEHETGHSATSLLFVRVRGPVRLDPLASVMCAECNG